jgi:GNAT superfamily N-acetyltransferase
VDLHIERILDASRTDDWQSVGVAALAHDQPDLIADPVEEIRAKVPDGSAGFRMEFHVGYAAEVPVARGSLGLPTYDNTDIAFLRLEVVPRLRRHGYGRAMFERLRERAVVRDRTVLVGEVPGPLDGTPPGALFAASLGAKEALCSIRRVLELERGRAAELANLETEAGERAKGYELVCWVDHAPDEVVDDVAALLGRMITDAPMGDLQMERENWNRSRVREWEDDSASWGRIRLSSGARDVSDGRLVALTEITVSRIQPEIAYQWDTIVAPAHRGHRLGQWVKSVNLRRLMAEMPDTKRVTTWNAETNRFMIEVNERLGFRPIDREYEWRLELAQSP